jgi:tetratricopeptide (TPR) repeat protein
MGTPGFMAPEQYESVPLDGRADQFSFCASLYYTLYRQQAFPGRDPDERAQATLSGKVRPPPREARVPGWVHRVVLVGLSLDKEARYASMEALLAALRDDPSVRRRRWVAAAGLLLVLGGAVAGYRFAAGRKIAACRAEGEAHAQLWTRDRQREVEKAFLATGKSFAPDAWRGFKNAIDSYVSGLSEMQETACVATRVQRESSEKVLALRSSCLHQRSGEVKALVDVFAQVDAQGVEKAAGAARGLKPLASCGDVDALMRQAPPPTTPGAAERLESLRTSLAQAKALHDAGKYEAAIAQAVPVVQGARSLPYAPLEAAALLQLGSTEKEFGKGAEAESYLVDAIEKGVVAHQEEVSADASAQLLDYLIGVVGREDDARIWYRMGQAFVKRAPAGQERTLAHLHKAFGYAMIRTEQYAEGERALRDALRFSVQAYGADSVDAAGITMLLAMDLLKQQRVAEGFPLSERAVAMMERAVGAEHPRLAGTLGNYGLACSMTGRYEQALAPMRRAIAIYERLYAPTYRARGTAYDNLGIALVQLGRLEEARQAMQTAVKAYEMGTPLQADMLMLALANLTSVLTDLGRLDEARAASNRALELLKAHPVSPSQESAMRINLTRGALSLAEGKPAESIPWFELVLSLEAAGNADASIFASARFHLAQARWRLHKSSKEVVPLLNRAHAVLASSNAPHEAGLLEQWARAQGLPLSGSELPSAAR